MTKENELEDPKQEDKPQSDIQDSPFDTMHAPDENAFGLNPTSESVKEHQGKEPEENKPADKQDENENQDEPNKETTEKKPDEDEKPAENNNEKPTEQEQEKIDETVQYLIDKSPRFKDLYGKKKFKTVDDAFKTYEELEKTHSRKSRILSAYKELLTPFAKFDDEGIVIGYTDLGKQIQNMNQSNTKQKPQDQVPQTEKPSMNISPEQAKELGLSSQEATEMENLADKFLGEFDKNPIAAITKIVMAVQHHNQGSIQGSIDQRFEKLNNKLDPVFAKQREDQVLNTINDVASDLENSGDDKAQEFFDKYADEISAELKQVDPELLSVNLKLAIENSYRKVKDRKIKQLQDELKAKQENEIKKEQDAANTGESTAGEGEEQVDPEIQGMIDSSGSREKSVFFAT